MHVKIFIVLSSILWLAVTAKISHQLKDGNVFGLFWFIISLAISILGFYIIYDGGLGCYS